MCNVDTLAKVTVFLHYEEVDRHAVKCAVAPRFMQLFLQLLHSIELSDKQTERPQFWLLETYVNRWVCWTYIVCVLLYFVTNVYAHTRLAGCWHPVMHRVHKKNKPKVFLTVTFKVLSKFPSHLAHSISDKCLTVWQKLSTSPNLCMHTTLWS